MAEVKPQVLLVDGHSVIFAWPELRALHERRPAAARARLVEELVRLQDNTGRAVVVVFDGRGQRAAEDEVEQRVQVFYSKCGQTADALIERFVAKYAATHEITVATNDGMERTTVSTFGARWISAGQLEAELAEAEALLRRRLERLRQQERGVAGRSKQQGGRRGGLGGGGEGGSG